MSRMIRVSVERSIAASPERLAAVMFDPARYPEWMPAVRRVERTDTGAWVFGRFLGKDISWETRTIEHAPPHRLRLQIPEGAFRGEVQYEIEPAAEGSRVRITNSGEPRAFRWFPEWLTTAAMRRALRSDLDRLARLVERPE